MPEKTICIALSSDINGFPRNSTLIGSALRRISKKLFVSFYCQGFLPAAINQDRLCINFFRQDDAARGQFPGHVSSAVFDRLRVIRDATDWERCLIMDHDMLALCDLAPYFEEDFEGNLLMGRMFGPENTLGVQMAQRGGLPTKLKHTENYPYFYMGPMMNLEAMREEKTWEKLLAAHETLGQDEQMALTIATEGRVKGVGRKWNLVPHWDNLAEGPEGPEKSLYGTAGEAAEWKNGLPEGIIHWTGWAKPWNRGSGVWRPDLWAAEETTWEELRNGWWEKPQAAVVETGRGRKSVCLATRGWKVDFFPVTAAPEEETFASPKKIEETKTGPVGIHRGGPPFPMTEKGWSQN